MFARLNLCAVEFMLAAAAKPREDWFLAALLPFPTCANKQKLPATQATVIHKWRLNCYSFICKAM